MLSVDAVQKAGSLFEMKFRVMRLNAKKEPVIRGALESLHIEQGMMGLRQAPNGYFYDVITNGFGSMYSYSERIAPRDRWAIIAYLRALQLSRNAKVSDLPESLRQKVASAGASSGGAKE